MALNPVSFPALGGPRAVAPAERLRAPSPGALSAPTALPAPSYGYGAYPTPGWAPPAVSSPGSGVFEALKALFSGIAAAFSRAFRVLSMGDWRATAQRYGLQADLDNVWNFREEIKGYGCNGTLGPSLPGQTGQLYQLQQGLVRMGYLSYATGYFDDATAQAIILFKRMRGLHQNYKAADGNWAVNEYATPDVQRVAQDLASRPFVVTYQMQAAAQSLTKALGNIAGNFKYVKPVLKFLGMSSPDPDTAEAFFKDSKIAMEAMGKGEQPTNLNQTTAQWGNTLGMYASAAFGVLQLARTSANAFGLASADTMKAVDESLVDLGAVSQASQVFAYAAQAQP